MKKNIDLRMLPSNTCEVLQLLINLDNFLKNFTLVGGTALSLYFNHRKSEDLDFFTYDKLSFDKKLIINTIIKIPDSKIINESEDQIDFAIKKVKVTFYNSQYEFLRTDNKEKFNIASIEALIALKVQVLYFRAKFRDYYDLYFIIKKFGINKVLQIATKHFPQLNEKLFQTALLFIDDIEEESINYLEPIENLSKKDIQKFFEKEIRKAIK